MLKTQSLETWYGLVIASELPNKGEFDLFVTYIVLRLNNIIQGMEK